MKHIVYLLMWGLLVLTACTSNLKKENEVLRDEIDERREHLENSLKVNLEAARQELAVTDSLLGIAKREHDEQHEWVMSHATALGEQSPEVLRLNRLRAQRDSLQVEFERQAQKVKFYMKKTEERAAN